MDTSLTSLSLSWLVITSALTLGAVVVAIRRVPVGALLAEPRLQHLIFSSVLILALTWSFRAGLSDGLSIHFLGMTTLTLMFGWDLAVLVGCLAYLLLTLVGAEPWMMLPVNMLTLVVIPASASVAILYWVERLLPPNFFVYLFLVAFLGGGLTAVCGGLSLALVLGLDGVLSWTTIYREYVLYLPLIAFPEGLLNGIIMTAMMVFHPDWIRTFDAKRYIDDQ